MRCISPLKAGYNKDGDLVYTSNQADQSIIGIEFECRKCLPCRLNQAREKSIRAVHEAKQHDKNIFLTLTYDEEHLQSDKLVYSDFQKFMKSLRKTQPQTINYMVTGEYGEKNKRPHWHALIFNYEPSDAKYSYKNELGDKLYTSEKLSKLWKRGKLDFGEVTLESAGYVARYAAKKLVHGKDEEHEYHPIHKTSSKYGIGRSWIEEHYEHTFDNGFVVLPNGSLSKIPRYYVDWLKKHKPEKWMSYVTQTRQEIMELSELKQRKEDIEYFNMLMARKHGAPYPTSRAKVKETILKSKFKRLQENLKL